MINFSRRLCLAPMMEYTDRHFRYMLRLITPNTFLYTEMITAAALCYGDAAGLLAYDASEHPVALQLGGSDISQLIRAAQLAQDAGYDEVNLNVGCPSGRVQNAQFGACLMKMPGLVAECVAAMKNAVQIPVTVKCRIGVDDLDSYDYFKSFIHLVAQSGCEVFIVHARKAWLQGLSPKENREIPPLCYETVYQLKKDFPQLEVIINGGIKTQEDVLQHLKHVDGVMIGREAVNHCWLLGELDQSLFDSVVSERLTVIKNYLSYAEQQKQKGERHTTLLKPLLGLFHAYPKSRSWRQTISSQMCAVKPDFVMITDIAEELLELAKISLLSPTIIPSVIEGSH